MYMFLMRDEKEDRKKQAKSNKQTRQSNTAHPLFPTKKRRSCVRWHDTLYSTRHDRALYHWLGPNLTSHSSSDEQANQQLRMKEKDGLVKPPKTHVHVYMYIYSTLCISLIIPMIWKAWLHQCAHAQCHAQVHVQVKLLTLFTHYQNMPIYMYIHVHVCS